jgi:hypothetical protein
MLPQRNIPKYKITRGYTSGGEYIVKNTTEDYIGFYHIYPNGAIYSNNELLRSSVELVRSRSLTSATSKLYYSIKKLTFDKHVLPVFHMPVITDENRNRGTVSRYFAQKINEPQLIIEIDFKQAKAANRSNKVGINRNIWNVINIEWTISGDIDQVRKANNKVLTYASRTIPGIDMYLTDLLEFHK